tara:strand:- start:895 stop:1530 length:636 start_codon:yes stop_codon:yes gene_type:complete
MSDWRKQFLPGEAEPIEEEEVTETSELGNVWQEGITETDIEGETHIDDDPEADYLQLELSQIAENQQRIMMAIDQMASGFSNQLVILARRIDNFERVLDQSLGQPTMTNLMFDAPEVFNKVVNRDAEDVVPRREQEREDEPKPATEPRTPVEGFEIPDEVEHLLNYSADFPVSVEIQTAFHMWKAKLGTFNQFVKVAGGPVAAKKARSHLE